MFTTINSNVTRQVFSAFAAVAIVGSMGLAFGQGHFGPAPRGIVEIGELVPVEPVELARVAFPEIEVVASRLPAEPVRFAADLPRLPEVVVVGRREVAVAAADSARDTQG